MSSQFCTTVMCSEGKAKVQQMRITYENLKNNPSFNTNRFADTVNSIEESFDAEYTMFSEWIPFNSACCTIGDIGEQAAIITNQMLQSVGSTTVPTAPKPPDTLGSLATIGIVVAGLVLFSNVKTLIPSRR